MHAHRGSYVTMSQIDKDEVVRAVDMTQCMMSLRDLHQLSSPPHFVLKWNKDLQRHECTMESTASDTREEDRLQALQALPALQAPAPQFSGSFFGYAKQ